jgi:biotin carboxyl carrier protein
MAEHIVEAPAAGKVLRVVVKPGDRVEEGDSVCVLEALKMELPISAPATGTVTSVAVSAGQAVEAGDTLAIIQE